MPTLYTLVAIQTKLAVGWTGCTISLRRVEGQSWPDGTKQRLCLTGGFQQWRKHPYYLRLICDRYRGNGGIDKYGVTAAL
jgi:hypothetical protein